MSKIRKRPDGRWEARVELPRAGDGGRRRKSIFGKTRNEVSMKLARFRLAGPPPENASSVTVETFLKGWLESVKPRLARTTHANYVQVANSHITPHLGRLRLDRLKPSDVRWLYDKHASEGVSGAVSRRAANILCKALADATKEQLIAANPAAVVDKPRPTRREMAYLRGDELRAFLQAAEGDRLYPLFVVAASTGMRQGELLGLRWGDVDFDAGEVFIQRAAKSVDGKVYFEDVKTAKSRRRIPLTPQALTALATHRKAMLAEGNIDATVFCGPRGGPLCKNNLRARVFKPILEASGVSKIRFHDLRHTAATLLLSQGVPVTVVSQMLGHANAHVTLTVYAHAVPGQQNAAAEAMARIMAGG